MEPKWGAKGGQAANGGHGPLVPPWRRPWMPVGPCALHNLHYATGFHSAQFCRTVNYSEITFAAIILSNPEWFVLESCSCVCGRLADSWLLLSVWFMKICIVCIVLISLFVLLCVLTKFTERIWWWWWWLQRLRQHLVETRPTSPSPDADVITTAAMTTSTSESLPLSSTAHSSTVPASTSPSTTAQDVQTRDDDAVVETDAEADEDEDEDCICDYDLPTTEYGFVCAASLLII